MSDRSDAADLHLATDKLNRTITRAEEVLRSLDLGVFAEIPIPNSSRRVAFGKLDGMWRLFVTAEHDSQPLVNASRETRVAAAPLIAKLCDSMRAEVVEARRQVEAATKTVEEFIDRETGPTEALR